MALKENGRRQHTHYTGAEDKKDTAQLSHHLAPPEEKAGQAVARQSAKNGGAIRVDTGSLKFPKGFVEEDKASSKWLGLEPVVLIILCLALAFIAFIAWQVSLMEQR
jgi:hypothetical protein